MVRQPLPFIIGRLSIQCFDSPPFFNTVSQTTSSYLLLTVQHLRDLRDVMPHHWSPDVSHPPFTTSARIWESVFYSQAFFTLPSKVPGLHSDHRNIAQAQLLIWITAIHKRGILIGSVYVPKASFKVKVPQPWNLPLTGFEPAFLKVPCNNSHLSWWLGYRV